MATHPDLPFEQAINREYLKKLERKLRHNPLQTVDRNVIWIDEVDHQIKATGYHHPLLGRIGCSEAAEDDLQDFYIGSRFIDDGEILVYSWAAPIARLFFQPGSEGSDDVVVRRTFSHKITDVIDFEDEWAKHGARSPFVRRELKIPAPAPATSTRRRPASPQAPTPRQQAAAADLAPAPNTADPVRADTKTVRVRKVEDVSIGMRAKQAVLRRLTAPRKERLLSVLALLQPDQHALTSWPADQDLVVQGHPGTGKTVVAAYRAAYLVNPALYDPGGVLASRADRPLRVLVVGPTSGYVNHVRGLIEPLAPATQVQVTNITQFLIDVSGMKGRWSGGLAGTYDDVDARAAELVERAADQLRRAQPRNQVHLPSAVLGSGTVKPKKQARDSVEALYEILKSNGRTSRPLSNDPDEIRWMRGLPSYRNATQRRLLPLLAQCKLAAAPIRDAERFDHIIVDEAQDVSPIEWTVLQKFLRSGGRWTLVGDMNQRRSDVTYGSWKQIAEHLDFPGLDRFEAEVMDRGYRSTGAILKFADRLLPAKERDHRTVQDDGDPVQGRRITRETELSASAVETAARLAQRHEGGSTAIITVTPRALITELGRKGWRRPGASKQQWTKGTLTLRLHVPESARGLEFDAVVVVEPGAFPANLGRTGPLYTSLTRANKELSIVWHRDLPEGLRRALRS